MAKVNFTQKQHEESCKALDFYNIKHQGKFMDHHIKELEKARMTPCPRLKAYAYKLHEKLFPKITDSLTDKYAPPGPDSKLWTGTVYSLSL